MDSVRKVFGLPEKREVVHIDERGYPYVIRLGEGPDPLFRIRVRQYPPWWMLEQLRAEYAAAAAKETADAEEARRADAYQCAELEAAAENSTKQLGRIRKLGSKAKLRLLSLTARDKQVEVDTTTMESGQSTIIGTNNLTAASDHTVYADSILEPTAETTESPESPESARTSNTPIAAESSTNPNAAELLYNNPLMNYVLPSKHNSDNMIERPEESRPYVTVDNTEDDGKIDGVTSADEEWIKFLENAYAPTPLSPVDDASHSEHLPRATKITIAQKANVSIGTTSQGNRPETDVVLPADFGTLLYSTPPDISQHPAFQADPFTSVSNAPLMVTNSSTEEIKDYRRCIQAYPGGTENTITSAADDNDKGKDKERAVDYRNEYPNGRVRKRRIRLKKRENDCSDGNDKQEGNKQAGDKVSNPSNLDDPKVSNTKAKDSAFGHTTNPTTLNTPGNDRAKGKRRASTNTTNHAVPDVASSVKGKGKERAMNCDPSSTRFDDLNTYPVDATPEPATPASFQTSSRVSASYSSQIPSSRTVGRVRKSSASSAFSSFAKLFRTRSSVDESDLPVEQSVRTIGIHKPVTHYHLNNTDLERFLRIVLNTRAIPAGSASQFPDHPNTSRGWQHQNLKCTVCLKKPCGICGALCCAYRSLFVATYGYMRDNKEFVQEMQIRMQEINQIYPYGREIPTFLRCARDGEGCGAWVCTDCCGICPTEECRAVKCRRCKRRPWEECESHAGL